MRVSQSAPREYVALNRSEYSMSREDDFAQSASVRAFVEGTRIPTETELYRLAIDAKEPFRTTTFTDDPDELAALASQSTRQQYWIAYADGKIIAKEPTGRGSWRKVSDQLHGYIARERLFHGRVAQAATMDKVSAHHLHDLPEPPLSTPTIPGEHDASEDRTPRELAWIDEWINPLLGNIEEGTTFEREFQILPYVENVTEGAMIERGYKKPAPTCQ